MGDIRQIVRQFMKFIVVDSRPTYHRVLGRPTLKELWAITSIHHLCIKFSQSIASSWVEVIK